MLRRDVASVAFVFAGILVVGDWPRAAPWLLTAEATRAAGIWGAAWAFVSLGFGIAVIVRATWLANRLFPGSAAADVELPAAGAWFDASGRGRARAPHKRGAMPQPSCRATRVREVSMDARKSDLEQKVLRLSVPRRARLARVLLESLDDESEEGVEAAWAAEAKQRAEELRNGQVKGRTSAQVQARARAAISALK